MTAPYHIPHGQLATRGLLSGKNTATGPEQKLPEASRGVWCQQLYCRCLARGGPGQTQCDEPPFPHYRGQACSTLKWQMVHRGNCAGQLKDRALRTPPLPPRESLVPVEHSSLSLIKTTAFPATAPHNLAEAQVARLDASRSTAAQLRPQTPRLPKAHQLGMGACAIARCACASTVVVYLLFQRLTNCPKLLVTHAYADCVPRGACLGLQPWLHGTGMGLGTHAWCRTLTGAA